MEAVTNFFKYCYDFNQIAISYKYKSYLVVVRTVGALLDAGVLAYVTDLHADHGVHVQARQLASLDHCHTNLEVSCLQCGWDARLDDSAPGVKGD